MTTVKTNLGPAREMRAESRRDPHEEDRMILPMVETEMGMTTERGIDIENSCITETALVALVGARSLKQALLRAGLIGMGLSGLGFGLAIQPAINLPPGPVIALLCLALLPLAQALRRAQDS